MKFLTELYRKYVLKRKLTDQEVKLLRNEIKQLVNELERSNIKTIKLNLGDFNENK